MGVGGIIQGRRLIKRRLLFVRGNTVICNCLNCNYHCKQSHLHLNQTKTVVKVGPVQGCCFTVFQLDLNDTERGLLNFF